ncbi:hypothetical protein DFJ43DRAFT_1118277 [Lentinula guzmanii]|uniref:Uncharacterized protein n=1 Tax=Lentinula guzmanii TaxID=2804957 RepID=A0AA38N0J3_9AGAR|nr:hypothetical protein DFJ43DRAFT_1118277 [Lentinula guzmanii]
METISMDMNGNANTNTRWNGNTNTNTSWNGNGSRTTNRGMYENTAVFFTDYSLLYSFVVRASFPRFGFRYHSLSDTYLCISVAVIIQIAAIWFA